MVKGYLRQIFALGFAATCFGFAATASSQAIYGSRLSNRLFADVTSRLNLAENELLHGNWKGAIAQADAVLLNQTLRVSVQYDWESEKRRVDCDRALNEAIELWKSELGDSVQFEFVTDPYRANIVIFFQQKVRGYAREVGGHARWGRSVQKRSNGDYRVDFHGDVFIQTKTNSGRSMDISHMRHSLAHEIGHLFGLDDSNEVGSIMGPLDLARPAQMLSSTDLEALRAMRSQANDLRKRTITAMQTGNDGYTPLNALDRGTR